VPSLQLKLYDQHRYTMEELLQLRRQMLRFARSLPPGPERNARRQIELSLRSLFKNKEWLAEHTVDGSRVIHREVRLNAPEVLSH
jgi:hypothetical protein